MPKPANVTSLLLPLINQVDNYWIMTREVSTRGRRSGPNTTREELLHAGAALLKENGLQALSAREAALRAGVNPAMVRHFFGDRLGYLAALMDFGFQTLLPDPVDDAEPPSMAELIRALHRSPWLAHLLVQTVYAGDELRGHFEASHAPRLLAFYRRFLSEGQAHGTIRRDLPDSAAITGLISLIVFPIVAGQSLENMLFEDEATDFAETSIVLVTTLFAQEAPDDTV